MRVLLINRNTDLVRGLTVMLERAGHEVLHAEFVCYIRYRDVTFVQPSFDVHTRLSYDDIDFLFCSAPVSRMFLNYQRGPSILLRKVEERGKHAVGIVCNDNDRVSLESQGFTNFITTIAVRGLSTREAVEKFLAASTKQREP